MTTKRNIEFMRPAPERGDSSDVFIKLTPHRIPGYKRVKNRVEPKELRWLDDDTLTTMEEAIYRCEL